MLISEPPSALALLFAFCFVMAGFMLFAGRFTRDWLCDPSTGRLLSYTGLIFAFAAFWAFVGAMLHA